MNNQELSPSEAQNLKFEGVIMFCLVSAAKSQSVQWYVSMEKWWIHEQREKTEENWRKKICLSARSITMNPTQSEARFNCFYTVRRLQL